MCEYEYARVCASKATRTERSTFCAKGVPDGGLARGRRMMPCGTCVRVRRTPELGMPLMQVDRYLGLQGWM
jgi:hypothetical protein